MNPPPRLTYTTTREEALALGLEAAGQTRFVKAFRRHGRWFFTLPWLAILITLNWPLGGKSTVNGEPAPLLGTLVSLAIIVPFGFLFGWGTAKILGHMGTGWIEGRLRNHPDSFFTAERWIEATEEGFVFHHPEVEQRYPWTSFTDLRLHARQLILVGTGNRALVILPLRAFASPEAQKEFVDYCKGRIDATRPNTPDAPRPSCWKRMTAREKVTLVLALLVLLLLLVIALCGDVPTPS